MRSLRDNMSLKVASLALAVGIWFYVRGEDRPIQIVTVPLELVNLASDLAIAGDTVETINARVQAPEAVLKTLGPERIRARIDLSAATVGDQVIRLRPEELQAPPGVEVVRVSPEAIPMRIERKIRRDLPVRARITGEPASGRVLGEVTVQPAEATVEGPESLVREAREVETDIIRIDGRSAPFDVVAGLFPDQPGVTVAHHDAALVSVDIHERYVTRILPGVRVVAEGATFPVRLSPQTVEVTVEGPPGLLAEIEPDALRAVCDVAPLSPRAAEYRIRPRIVFTPEAPGGKVVVRSVDVKEVSVRVMARPAP